MTKTPIVALAALVIAPTAYGSPKVLTSDPLTGLPLNSATVSLAPGQRADSSAGINGMQGQDAGRFLLDLWLESGCNPCLVQGAPIGIQKDRRVRYRPFAGHVLQTRWHVGCVRYRESRERRRKHGCVFRGLCAFPARPVGESGYHSQPAEGRLPVGQPKEQM